MKQPLNGPDRTTAKSFSRSATTVFDAATSAKSWVCSMPERWDSMARSPLWTGVNSSSVAVMSSGAPGRVRPSIV